MNVANVLIISDNITIYNFLLLAKKLNVALLYGSQRYYALQLLQELYDKSLFVYEKWIYISIWK